MTSPFTILAPPVEGLYRLSPLTERAKGKITVHHWPLTQQGREHYQAEYQALREQLAQQRSPLSAQQPCPEPQTPYKAPKANPLSRDSVEPETPCTVPAEPLWDAYPVEEQSGPGRHAAMFAHNGLVMSGKAWADRLGYSYGNMLHRLRCMPIEQALTSKRCPSYSKPHRGNRHGRSITYQGKTATVREWAESIGVKADTLHRRLRDGESLEQAMDLRSRRGGARTR
ncbi:hypothetical protein [Teichococcus vastitatis]|uniref:hypothetical protein n=1 Tax=Teichococcus vastitatis TaxID=2307076 RepID=UPI0013004BC7|nr:hypothetical protein [Pseudoroseomonas vastitatis]